MSDLSVSLTVIGMFEMGASSTGPAASCTLRASPAGGPAAWGWGLRWSLIIFTVRFSSCLAMNNDGSMASAFWNSAKASSNLPSSRSFWPL